MMKWLFNSIKVLAILSLGLTLIACGGGGTKKECTKNADCKVAGKNYCNTKTNKCEAPPCLQTCVDLEYECGDWTEGSCSLHCTSDNAPDGTCTNGDCLLVNVDDVKKKGTCCVKETCDSKGFECGKNLTINDGCGGKITSCGTNGECPNSTDTCGSDYKCTTCTDTCGTRECGNNPGTCVKKCGPNNGACPTGSGKTCNTQTGMCVTCNPACGNRECGAEPNGCGMCGPNNGECTAGTGLTCDADGKCVFDGLGEDCPNGDADCQTEPYTTCVKDANDDPIFCSKTCTDTSPTSTECGQGNCCLEAVDTNNYCFPGSYGLCVGTSGPGEACMVEGINLDASGCQEGLMCVAYNLRDPRNPSSQNPQVCNIGACECLAHASMHADCVTAKCMGSMCVAACNAQGQCTQGFEPDTTFMQGYCLCFPIIAETGTSEGGETCPFYNASNPDASECVATTNCLGFTISSTSDTCDPTSADQGLMDCWVAGFPRYYNPYCADCGRCSASFCAPNCVANACSEGYEKATVGGQCMCIPNPVGTQDLGEQCLSPATPTPTGGCDPATNECYCKADQSCLSTPPGAGANSYCSKSCTVATFTADCITANAGGPYPTFFEGGCCQNLGSTSSPAWYCMSADDCPVCETPGTATAGQACKTRDIPAPPCCAANLECFSATDNSDSFCSNTCTEATVTTDCPAAAYGADACCAQPNGSTDFYCFKAAYCGK